MRKLKNSKQPFLRPWDELNQQALKLQSGISTWLNWQCRHLSAKTLLAILIAFCSICGTYLLWLILGKIN